MPVTRLDAAVGSGTNSPSYPVSAGLNRGLVVGVTQEVSSPAQLAVAFGDEPMIWVDGILVGDSTDQRCDMYWLNDAGIAGATGNTVTLTSPPTSFTIHIASYENVVQTTPTVTDTYAVTGAGDTVLSLTSTDDGCVACVAGMGNDGAGAWSGGVTEQTDVAVGTTAVGTFADELIVTGGSETYNCAWTPAANRRAGVAVNLAFLAAEGITGIDPTTFNFDSDDVDVNGLNFLTPQGSGEIYLSDANTLAGSANEVDITSAVSSWSDTSIHVHFSQLSAGEIADLHTLGPGQRYIILVNDDSDEYGSAVITLHRPEAFVISDSGDVTDGAVTTSRLSGGTGSFNAGLIHDTQNPADSINIGTDNNTEVVFCAKAISAAREVAYVMRITVGGTLLDGYTDTPQITPSLVSALLRATAGVLAAGGILTRTVTFGRSQVGDIDGAGSVTRKGTLVRPQAGAFDAAGDLARQLSAFRSLIGDFDGAGVLVRKFTAPRAIAGNLPAQNGVVLRGLIASRSIVGTESFSAIVERIATFPRATEGDLSGTGSLSRKTALYRRIQHAVVSVLSFTGEVYRTLTASRSVSGALGFAGTVAGEIVGAISRAVEGAFGATGVLTRVHKRIRKITGQL